jgi:hypothetical protein
MIRRNVYIHSGIPLCILQHAKFLVSLATVVALELILRDGNFPHQATIQLDLQRTTLKPDACMRGAPV